MDAESRAKYAEILRNGYKDPLAFIKAVWPKINLYKEQREIVESIRDNDETIVPAANMMGKDFVAGIIVLWYCLSRNPCRIVTTSVKAEHLKVLWGEIGRRLQDAEIPLTSEKGGPLRITSMKIQKVANGIIDPYSYVVGMVAGDENSEAMQGHHCTPSAGDPTIPGLPLNLFVVDEASAVADSYYTMASTWAKRIFIFGNTHPCNNFFKRAITGDKLANVPGGSLLRDKANPAKGYFRKVIKIKADASPNVIVGIASARKGLEPFEAMPGVLTYAEYCKRRQLWDKVKQTVSLDADFYEGAENLLYPPEWLDLSEVVAKELPKRMKGRTMGVDSAAGGDKTAFCICDDLGVIHLEAYRTEDTTQVPERTITLMKLHGIDPKNVLFDAGGGGKQHADRLRKIGYKVRTVGFGESPSPEIRRGMYTLDQRKDQGEQRYVYMNRRAEMYGILSERMDPANLTGTTPYPNVFAIPGEYVELRRQLAPIPKLYDGEGRMMLPPKQKRGSDDTRQTMLDLIGCSPDEADALVLAVFGMSERTTRIKLKAG